MRRVGEAGVDAEVLGEGHGRDVVADAVDVAQLQTGVVERLADHRRLESAAAEVELPGR